MGKKASNLPPKESELQSLLTSLPKRLNEEFAQQKERA